MERFKPQITGRGLIGLEIYVNFGLQITWMAEG